MGTNWLRQEDTFEKNKNGLVPSPGNSTDPEETRYLNEFGEWSVPEGGGGGGSSTLAGLDDVHIQSVASGEILKHDGTKWVNSALIEDGVEGDVVSIDENGGIVDSGYGLSKTHTVPSLKKTYAGDSPMVDGETPLESGTVYFQLGSGGGGGASALSELSDVTIQSAANGQVLTYNGTKWQNAAIPVDSVLSSSSTNAVQNKVVKAALDEKIADNPTFSEAATRANINSGESISTLFGKIKKWFSSLGLFAFKNSIETTDLPSGTVIDASYVHTDNNYSDTEKAKVAAIPVNVSDLNNDTGFITNTVNNLTNYYTKSETYTQAEVNSLIAAIHTLSIEIVAVLPTTGISTTTIYLVPKSTTSTQDIYDEYINTNGTTSGWEHIGSTEIDLTNYYTKAQVDTLLDDKVDKVDGKGLSTNDFTNAYKQTIDSLPSSYAPTDAEKNVIVGVQRNGTDLTVDANRKVNISVPINTSDLVNDSDFVEDADYTHTDNNYSDIEKAKVAAIPTKTSDLDNDSDFVEDANYVHTDNNYTSTEKATVGSFLFTNPQGGDAIIYNATTGKWVNALPFRLSVVNGKIAQTITEE